jgi:Transmembrane domain of unknown function (DUF3566)
VSVNGAEEDGVDNRVEAPLWAPDGGSSSTAPGDQAGETEASGSSEETEVADFSEPAPHVPSTPHMSQDAAGSGDPVLARTAGTVSASPLGSVAPVPGPTLASGTTSQGPALPAAMGAAAGAARGLAAKVSAPFSGLTKPKPKLRPKPKAAVRRPGSNGLAPRPQDLRPQVRITPGDPSGPQTRRAQLRLDRIEPASVMKFSFLLSIIGCVILFVAVAVLYFVLSKLGVFASIERTVGSVTYNKSNPLGANAASWFKASRVFDYTLLVGGVNVILMTALATIGAILYNLLTRLVGGIEVTLRESD